MKAKLRYVPREGATVLVPDLLPDQEIEVDEEEARRLLETGLFEPVQRKREKEVSTDGNRN